MFFVSTNNKKMNTQNNQENQNNTCVRKWIRITRYFKHFDGEQAFSSVCFSLKNHKNILKETVKNWKYLFSDQNDFCIIYQVVEIIDGAFMPYLNENKITEEEFNELVK